MSYDYLYVDLLGLKDNVTDHNRDVHLPKDL